MQPTIAGMWTKVSGSARGDCVALAGRYEEQLGYRPPHLETWVVRIGGGLIETLHWGQRSWFTGIWRDDAGGVYVSDMDQLIHHRAPEPDAASVDAWTEHRAVGNMMGIWGLAPDYIMSWGLAAESKPCMMLWEGQQWRRVDAPDFIVWAMHGSRRDMIFVVGDEGRVARWNGVTWTEMSTPATGTLNAVHCVSEDEVYVCGRDGELLSGSARVWTDVLEADGGLHGVAKWRDEVWVGGAMPLGLCKLEEGVLVPVGPVLAKSFDTRGNLVFTTNEQLAETADGVSFSATSIEDFMAIVDGDPPSWL